MTMDKIYNVLWIEDEPEKMDGFRLNAESEGIFLHSFNTSKKGIEALKKDFNKYDAVILDAKGYDESEDEAQELTGLQSSITAIAGLEKQYNRKIPHCIFTGQPDLMTDSSFKSLYKKTPIYSKHGHGDDEKMFKEIKKLCNDSETTQLKHRYADVLEICDEKYLGNEHYERLIELMQSFDNAKKTNMADDLGKVRKILESLLAKLHHTGVIPDEKYYKETDDKKYSEPNLNGASTYIGGIIPKEDGVVSEILKHVTLLAQDSVHYKETLKYKVTKFMQKQRTGYLFQGLVAQFFEILVYMKAFIDEKTVDPNIVSGIVKLHKDGYAFLKIENQRDIYIPANLVKNHMLTDGMMIKKAIKIVLPDRNIQLKSIEE